MAARATFRLLLTSDQNTTIQQSPSAKRKRMNAEAPPNLPVYDRPTEFAKASLPEAVPPAPKHSPGMMSKMISKMLKPKMKAPKTRLAKPFKMKKPKKLKIV